MDGVLHKGAKPERAAKVHPLWWHLVVLCGGIALPVLAFLGWLLWQSASSERAELERQGRLAARTVAVDVERDLTTLSATLQALTYSHPLQAADLASFHDVATRLGSSLDLAIVLFDRSGRQLVNTRRGRGELLPKVHPEVQRGISAVLETRKPHITDVFVGQVAREPLYAIVVPVFQTDTSDILYLLQLSVPAERIRNIILNTVRPDDGVALVADRKTVTLARNRLHERFEGSEATTLTHGTPAGDGTFRSVTPLGIPVLVFTAPVPGADWTVAVGIEEAVLNRPARDLLRLLSATGALLILLSAGLATLVGRRLTQSLQGLVASAEALGRRAAVPQVQTPVEEVNAVADAHVRAARDLRDALTAKDALLYEVNHRVKNSLSLVVSLLSLQLRQAADPGLQQSLHETRSRIAVVAAVHRRLYESGRHNSVEVGPFLNEIVADTVRVLDIDSRLSLAFDLQEGVVLGIEQATPLILIVTELVTNAAKHAFPDAAPGTISVTLHEDAQRVITAVVADNGRGWPNGGPGVGPTGLGMRIVEALTRQLRAEVSLASADPGTRVTITFPART